MVRVGLLVSGLLCFLISSAQTIVSGKVLTSEQASPLPFTTILVTNPSDSSVITYGITKSNGEFILRFSASLDSIGISASHLGYLPLHLKIPNHDQEIDLSLNESTQELNEIVIDEPIGISQSGDTISYDVESFKRQGDRVISDIISRLPGIQILDDGRVLYQGEPILKYYIEGLDLLEGRYNLANQNLPANAVENVQILENHQPIKILDSLIHSNQASLNIKLKNKITLTGESVTGVGYRPTLYNIKSTPLVFTTNQQFIGSVQANNIGDDAAKQLNILTIDDVLDLREGNFFQENILSIPQVFVSEIDENRWLNNNILLFTPNFLTRLKNDYQLKTNLAYLRDMRSQVGTIETNFLTSIDTVTILENRSNELAINSLEANIILEKNSSSIYFKNNLEMKRNWNEEDGDVSGTNDISQKLNTPYSSFSNRLKWIFPANRNLITLHSTVSHSVNRNQLKIEPGQFEQILNNGVSYASTLQFIELSATQISHSIALTHKIKSITLSSRSGFLFKSSTLDSDISLNQNDQQTRLDYPFRNDLTFVVQEPFTELTSELNSGSWKFNISSKLRFPMQSLTNSDQDIRLNRSAILVEPNFGLVKTIGNKITLGSNFKSHNRFGNMNNLYPGYVLTNYRNLNRNDPQIQKTNFQTALLFLKYKSLSSSFFLNAFYSYTNLTNNLLLNSAIDSLGTRIVQYIESENEGSNESRNLSVSKYFPKADLTISLAGEHTINQRQVIVNQSISEFTNLRLALIPKISFPILKNLFIQHTVNIEDQQNLIQGERQSRIISRLNSTNFRFSINTQNILILTSEYYSNQLSNSNTVTNHFLDIQYQYQSANNFGLELVWNNILNKDTYSVSRTDNISFSTNTYQLRPSQILVNLRWKF